MSTLSAIISWSHIRLLFSLNYNAINYYIQVIVTRHISVRELESIIKSKEYERLPECTKNKLINKEKLNINIELKSRLIIHKQLTFVNN